jgi:tRNA pseudouridine55 synthase
MPPRALRPTGLLLVDKPAGPSSFAVIRQIRARTGARTGHAGTLDPFASGLLLVLSGSATRLAPWLVRLDKRYSTEIDLHARTSTGDLEGEVVAEGEPPTPADLLARLERLRGDVELPIPAASAVKVGGERAYRLARRGVAPEMPMRCSRIDRLDVIAYTDGHVALDVRVSSGTYIRAIADTLGGHCRTLRRTEVGPFRVEDADPDRILPPAEALPFLPAREVDAPMAEAIRQGRERVEDDVRVLHAGELVAVDGTVLP